MEQKRIWDHFQNNAPHTFDGNYPRLRYLLGMVTNNQERILNIGVGNGAFERLALEQGMRVCSLDPSSAAIDRLRAELRMGDRAKAGYSQNIPFPDAYFGTVVISEVLEHLDDDVLAKTLREIRRVLKDGGAIIGTVPARENLHAQFAICPHCGEHFHRWGHVQSFDEARLRQIMQLDFGNIKVREKYFVSWASLNIKGKAVAFAKLAFLSLGMHGQGENLVFSAMKT
jgi:SAM-dependent methyltransferase